MLKTSLLLSAGLVLGAIAMPSQADVILGSNGDADEASTFCRIQKQLFRFAHNRVRGHQTCKATGNQHGNHSDLRGVDPCIFGR